MDCFPDQNVIGGAPFNVAVHLKRLGEDAGIITKIGEDVLGSEIQQILQQEDLIDQLQVDENYQTGRVDVTLKNGQPSYLIHEGCGWEYISMKKTTAPDYFVFGSLALYFKNNKESFKNYRNHFEKTTFVCDLNLREPFYNFQTIDLCLSSADVLKINDEELNYLSKVFKVDDVIVWLRNEYGINKVLLTEGSKGAILYWEGKIVSCPVEKVENIKDTVGAGDSFTSMFLYGVIKKLPLNLAMQRAGEFAGLICQTKGAVPDDLSIYEKFKI